MRILGLGVCVAALSAACLEEVKKPPVLGQPCVGTVDCPAGLQCVGGICTTGGGDSDPSALGPRPRIRVLTESVRFVDVPRGRTHIRSLRLTNLGQLNLGIERVEVAGAGGRVDVDPNPGQFVIQIPPEGEFGFSASFEGSDGVAFTGSILIHSDDPIDPRVSVPLVVEYTGLPQLVVTARPEGQHAEDLSGQVIQLGPVPASLGRSHDLYVKNLGVGGMYAVVEPPRVEGDAGYSVSVQPTADGDGLYRLGRFAAFCNTGADCRMAGASCNNRVCWLSGQPVDALLVRLSAALAVGQASRTTLVVPFATPSGSSRSELRIDFEARGVADDLFVDPAATSFGPVSAGFPVSQIVRIANATGSPLQITRVELTGAGAQGSDAPLDAVLLAPGLPHPLPPLAEVLARIDFVATAARLGPAAAQLEIEGDHRPGDPYVVAVDGIARIGPALTTQPLSALDVGVVHIGVELQASVSLQNSAQLAADDLAILDLQVVDVVGDGTLAVSPPALPSPIPAGTSVPVNVACTPNALGELSGILRIVSDAPDNPVRSLPVRCDGIDPELELRYASRDPAGTSQFTVADDHPCRGDPMSFPSPCLDAGALYLGGASELDITIDNTGTGDLQLGAATLTPAGPWFSIVAAPAMPALAAGQRAVFTVRYDGDVAAAQHTATFDLTHDDADLPPISIGLVGSTTGCNMALRDCSSTAACAAQQTAEACCRDFADPDACLPGCTPCAPRSHTLRTCVMDTCSYSCQAGYFDLNGPADGCEYACVVFSGGVEACNRRDNDCNGWLDDGLALADDGGADAPDGCTPASAPGLLGFFDEQNFGSVDLSMGGQLTEISSWLGRLYRAAGDPNGDEDWLRWIFTELNACGAVGFRVELELSVPTGTRYELCGRARSPGVSPPFGLACDESGGMPVFDACVVVDDSVPQNLVFEWGETCGQADDQVIDLRVRAAAGGSASELGSCEPYTVRARAAQLF